MNWHEYLNVAQALGILAFAVEVISFSMKSDRWQIILRTVSSLVWMLHYHGLGKWVPTIIVAVDLVRYGSALFIRARPKLAYPAFAFFSVIYIAIAIYFENSPIDLLPGITGVLSCFSILLLSGIYMRIGFLGVMGSWLIYDFSIHSIGGVINNAVMLVANSITIGRMMQDQRRQA